MITSGTITTNFKTMKKSILGKYDQLKASGMVWSQRSSPIYINFDLIGCEEDFTQKLIFIKNKSLNHTCIHENIIPCDIQLPKESIISNSNNKDKLINNENLQSNQNDDHKQCFNNNDTVMVKEKSTVLDNLLLQAEEISRKINFLIKNANKKEKGQDKSIISDHALQEIDELKNQRRLLWKQIEGEELVGHSNKAEEIHKNNTEFKNIQELEEIPTKISPKVESSNNILNKEIYYLCKCPSNKNLFDKLQEEQPENLKSHNYQLVTDMMKNVFYCYDDLIQNNGKEINLNLNEQLLISKLIDHKDNFAIYEKNIKFINTDLCYLIPGMIHEGITIIIFLDINQSQNCEFSTIDSIEKRTQYLTEKCKIKVGQIVNSTDILGSSSIFTDIVKNEIKFLYLTYEAIENNSKLIGVLNVAKSQNNLTRIVFIIRSTDRKNSSINVSESLNAIINKIKDVPILIITENLAISDVEFLSVPFEIIETENDELNGGKFKKKDDPFINKINNNLFLAVIQKKSPLLTKNMEDIFNWLVNNHYLRNISKINRNKEYMEPGISSYGIIFSMTNRDAESINTWLNKNGIPAAFFHSKMNETQQKEVILNWETGGIKIVVIADTRPSQNKVQYNENEFHEVESKEIFYKPFIAKKDIRFVVHYSIPQSFGEYIEQANIAGQDGFIAHSLIMFNEIDVKIIQRMISVLPNDDTNADLQAKIDGEFKAIVDYCINDDIQSKNYCRRVEIMKHYGLKFQYQNCFCMCDRCEEHSALEEMKQDTTVHANNMLKIINVLNDKERSIKILPSLNAIINIYVGNKCIKKKVYLNNNQEIDSIEEIVPCAYEFKGDRKILLIKTLKELCDREILRILTKKTEHGSINYFEVEKSIEEIEDPIFV